jgi:hypothetical protein
MKEAAEAGFFGDVAQLGERYVRNVQVVGSNPIISTIHCRGAPRAALRARGTNGAFPPGVFPAGTGLQPQRPFCSLPSGNAFRALMSFQSRHEGFCRVNGRSPAEWPDALPLRGRRGEDHGRPLPDPRMRLGRPGCASRRIPRIDAGAVGSAGLRSRRHGARTYLFSSPEAANAAGGFTARSCE